MNLFEIWSIWIDNISSLVIRLGICIGFYYGLYRLIKHFIRYHAECQNDFAEQRKQRHSQQKMEDINRELDEIEISLDAIQNEKITPIWSDKPKKP